MPAFRSVVSVLLRALGDFLSTLKAGPAGGRLRRPSSRRQRHDGTGEPASSSKPRDHEARRIWPHQPSGDRRRRGRSGHSQAEGAQDATLDPRGRIDRGTAHLFWGGVSRCSAGKGNQHSDATNIRDSDRPAAGADGPGSRRRPQRCLPRRCLLPVPEGSPAPRQHRPDVPVSPSTQGNTTSMLACPTDPARLPGKVIALPPAWWVAVPSRSCFAGNRGRRLRLSAAGISSCS
jgi:hypothetical protein